MNSEVETLRAELATLRELVASVVPTPAPEPVVPLEPVPWQYTPPPTKGLAYIAVDPALRHLGVRRVRQLAVAVSLCKGAALVGSEVPTEYESVMKRVAAARGRGLSWRAALSECGLTPPDDAEIAHQSRALRDNLPRLWGEVENLMGRLEVTLPGWLFTDLLKRLRPYL